MSRLDDGSPTGWAVPAPWKLTYLPVTQSTNDDARRAAAAGAPERTVILADAQRAGRGRLGRAWLAPPGSSLLFSLVLRRRVAPIFLTAACSVALVEAIAATTGVAARIKWPNDIMVGERKAGGVLTEVVGAPSRGATVVGIGLNVNVDLAAGGLPASATSLAHEAGAPVPRAVLLRSILERIDEHLGGDDALVPVRIHACWEALLWRRHQTVRVDHLGLEFEGTVLGLSPSGALRVGRADGVVVDVDLGELVLPDRPA